MTDPKRPEDGDPAQAGSEPNDPGRSSGGEVVTVIEVTVTRTGGFAGLRRTWHAQPDTSEASHWIALIDQCPWDAADPAKAAPPSGADRFVWYVDARCGDAAREAALPDPDVRGPWRDLIDAVRSAGKASGRPPASPR